jgi:hypothetical protein
LNQTVIEAICAPPRDAFAYATADPELSGYFDTVQMFGERLDFIFSRGAVDEASQLIARRMGAHGIGVSGLRAKPASLENVFIALIEAKRAEQHEAEQHEAEQHAAEQHAAEVAASPGAANARQEEQ